jgi:UDP-N-acetylglucosamine 2-epimerase (non-hydrolysing)
MNPWSADNTNSNNKRGGAMMLTGKNLRASADCAGCPRIVLILGTRPEVIKMAPVALKLRALSAEFDTVVCSTGQHRDMLDQSLATFGLKPDLDLGLMTPRQTLTSLTTRTLDALDKVMDRERPDLVMVQGDTTSAMVGALAAYYYRVPVGHLEAGLRTSDLYQPFPEEGNRRLISTLAAMHFAPTPHADQRLRQENVPRSQILVTGNTVIDALLHVRENNPLVEEKKVPYERRRWQRRRVLLTMHRRESRGATLEGICSAIRQLVERNPQVEVVFPVHASPFVREPVHRVLGDNVRIKLVEPMDYQKLVQTLESSCFVMTDSGGIQEEAPSLGKPVLVLRDTTERPEAIEFGTSRLVGTEPERALKAAELLLRDEKAYEKMARAENPYGDGRAAERVVAYLRHYFGMTHERPAPFAPQSAASQQDKRAG